MLARIAILVLSASAAHAEFLRIEVFIRDMNCESCSQSLAASIERMRGVEKVAVDFTAATVRVDLTEKNRLGIDQVWDAIKRVGFTPGETKVQVRGAVKASRLEVPEIGKTFELDGDAPEGEAVELSGTVTPPPDPRSPIVIHLRQ